MPAVGLPRRNGRSRGDLRISRLIAAVICLGHRIVTSRGEELDDLCVTSRITLIITATSIAALIQVIDAVLMPGFYFADSGWYEAERVLALEVTAITRRVGIHRLNQIHVLLCSGRGPTINLHK